MGRRFALVLLLTILPGCRRTEPPPAIDAGAAVTLPAVSTPPPRHKIARKGGTDVTFLVVSDTHLGYDNIEKTHAALVPKMNELAGTAYPKKIGGSVAKPLGVVITGDLTEWGKVDEWERFVTWYGLRGEGKLRYPVYEMIGNHDKDHGPWVEQRVAERHGGRFYSWNWGDLHLVALGEAPDDEGLRFLKEDLDGLEADVPVLLFFHLALEGPWSQDHWFAQGTFKDRFRAILEGRNIVAIFHGHHHASGHYLWRGIDVFKPGAVKNQGNTFAVVHVTDETFTLGSFNFREGTWASTHEKSTRLRAMPTPQ